MIKAVVGNYTYPPPPFHAPVQRNYGAWSGRQPIPDRGFSLDSLDIRGIPGGNAGPSRNDPARVRLYHTCQAFATIRARRNPAA